MAKVLQFPGFGRDRGRKGPEKDKGEEEVLETDTSDAVESESVEVDEQPEIGDAEKEGAEVLSFAQAKAEREAEREAQDRQDKPVRVGSRQADSLRPSDDFAGSSGEFDRMTYLTRLMDSLSGSSHWSKRREINAALSTLQRGSAAQIAKSVRLRRDLIREWNTKDLKQELEESGEHDWVAKPSHYQAVIQELETRERRGY